MTAESTRAGSAGGASVAEAHALRIDVRDVGSGGDAVVWSWDGGGHVRVASRGEDARTLEGSFDESGQFRLLERAGSLGEQPATVVSEQVETNVFGATVERVHHLFGIVVERSSDAEGRLRSTTVTTPLGTHTMEVRPDGSRLLRWSVTPGTGEFAWDASGRLSATLRLAAVETGHGT